jgi:hypothetical protein
VPVFTSEAYSTLPPNCKSSAKKEMGKQGRLGGGEGGREGGREREREREREWVWGSVLSYHMSSRVQTWAIRVDGRWPSSVNHLTGLKAIFKLILRTSKLHIRTGHRVWLIWSSHFPFFCKTHMDGAGVASDCLVLTQGQVVNRHSNI